MKKAWLIVLVTITFFSCSTDDYESEFTYEIIPAIAVEIPDTLYFNEEAEIFVTYQRPSTCHSFAGFDFWQDENNLYFAVINGHVLNASCEDVDETVEEKFNFTPLEEEFYIFNIYSGSDENNDYQYITKQVPVMIE